MSEEPQSRSARLLLFAILLIALLLRLWGLSHDLHAGQEYHPDIPKQVDAANRFLDGVYFSRIGLSDYDGYPLFHAHLTEYFFRGYTAAYQAACDLLGLGVKVAGPSQVTLHWAMRALNVLLSTLAVLLVYRIVRQLSGSGPALFGALLMALSPSDIAGAHYGAGDPAAAFFALWCVERSLAVWQWGRLRDYIAAAFLAACAFGAKYHAAMCLLPLGLAHLLRQPSLRVLFAGPSIRRILLMFLAAWASLYLVIPSLFLEPGKTWSQIIAFLGHVSDNQRLLGALPDTRWWSRLCFSMERNGPALLAILSWPVILAALVAVPLSVRRNRPLLILVSLPLVYFLLGVTIRPLAHSVYHVLMTGPLFCVAAVLAARAWRSSARFSRPAVAVLALVALISLSGGALREGFLFAQRDLRSHAHAWASENVPARIPIERLRRGGYTFAWPEPQPDSGPGRFLVSSSIRPYGAELPGLPLMRFALEERSLPFFRHPTMDLHLLNVPSITNGFRMPVHLTVPSAMDAEVVFDTAPVFYRDARMVNLDSDDPVTRYFVRPTPIRRALAMVRCGPAPAFVQLELGGRRTSVSLQPGQARAVWFEEPSTRWPGLETGLVYTCHMQAGPGPVQVQWALDDEAAARALFRSGLMKESAPLLMACSDQQPADPALSLLAWTAVRASDPDAPEPEVLRARIRPFEQAWSAARVRDIFGVGPDYLEALPYLAWASDQVTLSSFRRISARSIALPDDSEEAPADVPQRRSITTNWWASSPVFYLEGGTYRFHTGLLFTRAPAALPTLNLLDATGTILTSAVAAVVGPNKAEATFAASLATSKSGLRLVVHGVESGWGNPEFSVTPDVIATLNEMGARYRDSRGPGHTVAATAPPSPESIPETVSELRARFPRDLTLSGCAVRRLTVNRGDQVGLKLTWSVRGFCADAEDLIVWVHALDAQGKTVFQGDHALLDYWMDPRMPRRGDDHYVLFPVPPDAAPGPYQLVVGLLDKRMNRRVDVLEADGGRARKKGVELPVTITVR